MAIRYWWADLRISRFRSSSTWHSSDSSIYVGATVYFCEWSVINLSIEPIATVVFTVSLPVQWTMPSFFCPSTIALFPSRGPIPLAGHTVTYTYQSHRPRLSQIRIRSAYYEGDALSENVWHTSRNHPMRCVRKYYRRRDFRPKYYPWRTQQTIRSQNLYILPHVDFEDEIIEKYILPYQPTWSRWWNWSVIRGIAMIVYCRLWVLFSRWR